MPKGCGRVCDATCRVVYVSFTFGSDKRGMTRFDQRFAALSRQMNAMPAPGRAGPASPPIASLIDRVNAAKQRYRQR